MSKIRRRKKKLAKGHLQISRRSRNLKAMSELSSEKIARALKGAGLSSKQRIEAATEAWLNDDLFFPNKDDFLFEWLCNLLIRSNLKNPNESPLLNIAYWQLLNKLMEH
ncbi:hypothetical protein F4703DRAFT_1760962, partial [Phycomyces blakesleeanus]